MTTPRSSLAAPAAEIPSLLREAVRLLYDKKGLNFTIFDLRGQYLYTDFIIICQGTSDRHVRTLAENVLHGLTLDGHRPLGIEGMDLGQWVLIDFTDVIIHVFQEPIRATYDLEGLWSRMPTLKAADLLPKDYLAEGTAKVPQRA